VQDFFLSIKTGRLGRQNPGISFVLLQAMKKNSFLRSRIASFKFAFQGIFFMFRTQKNAWIHLIATILVIALGFYFKLNKLEWCMIIFAIGLVISIEMINTAIETLTDLMSPEHHDKAGRVKDIAAGAVLIAAISAAVIGLIIFLPYLTGK
jgi:diacylglycerol kinase (ATP)